MALNSSSPGGAFVDIEHGYSIRSRDRYIKLIICEGNITLELTAYRLHHHRGYSLYFGGRHDRIFAHDCEGHEILILNALDYFYSPRFSSSVRTRRYARVSISADTIIKAFIGLEQ